MNDLAFVLRKVLGVADHAVVKTRTHGQQHVAVLHGVVGLDRSMHAQHAQKLRITGRVSAQTHQGVGAGVAQHVHQCSQLLRGIAQQHAAACVDVRPLGRHQQLQGLADLSAVALAHRVVAAHFHAVGVMKGALLEGHILRNIDHHRTGASGAGNVKGFLDRFGQVAHVLDQKVVLDDGAGDAHGVALLESVQADRMRGHLTGDDHHWNAVHIGGGDAGDGIGHARARGDQRHADFAGGARVAVSRMHSGLLVAHQHMLNGVLFVKRVVDVQDGTAGIAPDVLDVFKLQGTHQNFGAHELRVFVVGWLCDSRCGSEFRLGDFHDEPL